MMVNDGFVDVGQHLVVTMTMLSQRLVVAVPTTMVIGG